MGSGRRLCRPLSSEAFSDETANAREQKSRCTEVNAKFGGGDWPSTSSDFGHDRRAAAVQNGTPVTDAALPKRSRSSEETRVSRSQQVQGVRRPRKSGSEGRQLP